MNALNKNDGNFNTAIGHNALANNTSGSSNTAIGTYALYYNTGSNNIAIGPDALYTNVAGNNATAIGVGAMANAYNLITAFDNRNVAVGYEALRGPNLPASNSGNFNTALGYQTLWNNSRGVDNTANGYRALYSNTTGSYNTANGVNALYFNSSGAFNTANGRNALYNNGVGNGNTANGHFALYSNNGDHNTAIGLQALQNNTTGLGNTAIGWIALSHLIGGTNNIAIGSGSGTDPGSPNVNNTISIGNGDILNGANNQVILGNMSTTYYGARVSWSTFSDARIKTNIKEEVKGLDFILRLRPVTYYKSIKAMLALTGNKETKDFPGKYDLEKMKFSGFLAQEVEQAAKETGYDFSGLHKPNNSSDLYALSYESFVVPLVKGMQEQQAIIADKQKQIDDLKTRLERLEKLMGNK